MAKATLRICVPKRNARDLMLGKNNFNSTWERNGFMRVTTKNNKKEHHAEKPSEKELRVKTTGQYCHMLRKIQVRYILRYLLS